MPLFVIDSRFFDDEGKTLFLLFARKSENGKHICARKPLFQMSLRIQFQESISPTFYEQLLRTQIPKAQKKTALLVFWDLHA